MDGKVIFNVYGDLETIENKINTAILTYPSGTYLLTLKDPKKNTSRTTKIIKK